MYRKGGGWRNIESGVPGILYAREHGNGENPLGRCAISNCLCHWVKMEWELSL